MIFDEETGNRVSSPFAYESFSGSPAGRPGDVRSRPFLKVQDGCSMSCSYCKVPLARGRSVSRDFQSTLDAAGRIADAGFREIVLTGVNLGSYRRDARTLADLLDAVTRKFPSLRIRLSSLEPVFITPRLLEVIGRRQSIVSHFHLPLQSGSDRVLALMNRPYGAEGFRGVVSRLRRLRPDAHIAVDVMVGFPSESESDFESTRRLLEEVKPASLHVFRYSVREGTAAASRKDGVSHGDKVRRSRTLIEMGKELSEEYRGAFLGAVRPAVLQSRAHGFSCLTDNYIDVRISEERGSLRIPAGVTGGDIVQVRIERLRGAHTAGVIV
jgi:threonylcarbamoyladenosine tRNA methylthiotransferase MtaB